MTKSKFFIILLLLCSSISRVWSNPRLKGCLPLAKVDSVEAVSGDSLLRIPIDTLTAMDSLWTDHDRLAFDSITLFDIQDQIDFGFQRQRTIDVIVIHSNYYVGDDGSNPFSTEGCIEQFRKNDVTPHYMIERNGNVLKMVDEQYIAWHAGPSLIPGTDRTRVNQNSIGIEVVNTKTDPPTPAQYKSLLKLIVDIRGRYQIKYLMRHSDIAPGRKTDPWCFDWKNFCKKVREFTGDIITVEETEEEETEM